MRSFIKHFLWPQINEWKRRQLAILVLSQIYIFIFPLCASFISCHLIYPVPALPGVGKKGEEVHVCLALKAPYAGVLPGSSLLSPSRLRVLPWVENITRFSSATDLGVKVSERKPWHSVSWDSQSWDEEKRICSRLKNSSQGVLMQHCNDGEFCHWPRPFEPFYLPLDKGDGFIRFVNGRWLGGVGVKLGDKNRISPDPSGRSDGWKLNMT